MIDATHQRWTTVTTMPTVATTMTTVVMIVTTMMTMPTVTTVVMMVATTVMTTVVTTVTMVATVAVTASYAITGGGSLYSWGRGKFGALGHVDSGERDQPIPRLIERFAKVREWCVTCVTHEWCVRREVQLGRGASSGSSLTRREQQRTR